jgi:SAM-dependent methyltransferase
VDWQGWLDRWDAQQRTYVPEREERFAVIADVVGVVAGERPRVLDLGCGPGSLSLRLLERFPSASVVAVDADPVLLTLGRRATAGRSAPAWVDADLRSPDWAAAVPAGPYDAVVSTTALHWLPAARLPSFYAEVFSVLRAGGAFVDGDHLDYAQPGLSGLAKELRAVWDGRLATPEADDWAGWWERLSAEPELAAAFAERAARRHEHPPGDESSRFETHRDALARAGFAEVGTVWQAGTDRVLVALRE